MDQNNKAHLPIGIFDSGFGGLTVLKEIHQLLPHEDLIYLGDAARLPYGNKSPETIAQYSFECAKFLNNQQVKLIIVACHTASCNRIEKVKLTIPLPIIDMVDPCIEFLSTAQKPLHLGILATQATIASQTYQKKISSLFPDIQYTAIPCPLFVPLVEEGLTSGLITDQIIHHYLETIANTSVNAVFLGCTHYPLLKNSIQKYLPSDIKILDPGQLLAHYLQNYLIKYSLLNQSSQTGNLTFYTTDIPHHFSTLGKIFLDYPLQNIAKAVI